MAHPEAIESMRRQAYAEQMEADLDHRAPHAELLSSLGETVAARSLVVCYSPVAYYYDGTKIVHKMSEPLDMQDVAVAGRFAGVVATSESKWYGPEEFRRHPVHFFLNDTADEDKGFMCPVGTTTLHDVDAELGQDDSVNNELIDLITAKKTDIFSIAEFLRSVRDTPHFAYYLAQLRMNVFPKNVFQKVFADTYLTAPKLGNVQAEIFKYAPGLAIGLDLGANDVFSFLDYLDVDNEPQSDIVIRRGLSPVYMLPLGRVVDHVPK